MTSWTDYQDDISDAISESVDIDWNASDGARAVVRWLNENVSLTASANDALALRAMLDNLVIAQGLSKEIREHATDAARSYLYNTRAMLSAAPAPEGGAALELIEAAKECLRLGRSTGEDTPENRKRARAQYRLNQLTTPKNIIAALATREEAPAEAGEIGDALFRALRSYKLTNMACEDDPSIGYPLVDLMSNDGTDISTGEEEMRVLADHLSEALRAQPQARSWGWDYEICTGCSASLTASDIKAGGHVSCCPDRRMVTVRDLVDAYEAQRKPQAREVSGPAEPEVGRAIYERIEKLLTDDPNGWERQYLSHLVESVEEVGGYDGPQAREEAQPVAWACLTCNSPRAVDPCPKCGTALTEPAKGWVWPRTPDVARIRALAREVGYAIGVHGTMERDLDLIAAPWVAEAVTPLELAQHIASALGGNVLAYKVQDKPCGRWSCNINANGWFKLIDLSVMPPITHPATDALRVAVEALEAITDLSVNLRQGGPDSSDLNDLSDALNTAVDVAHEALAALQAEQKSGA
ncbi:hypothetical protein [Brevundimonas diminuta]|uniref:Uncharacterized protein n=1 Tax=Brevundimonas diminuta TaxID=293 RepID=A0A2X1AKM3_BREDI|nr:hypothetical protein [Brevundimonas diminuta]SPU44280.1 Uncharacterised protein [Brevundimonas diminuta]